MMYRDEAGVGWTRMLSGAEIPVAGPIEAAIKGAKGKGCEQRLICPHCFGEGYLRTLGRMEGEEPSELDGGS
jgi:hypothetical protein